jgi:thiol-disulfide isomerase/thioredoxin
MNFIKKNLFNIIFLAFIIFLFTPFGLPVRATLIKGVSYVTTGVFNLELDKSDVIRLNSYDWTLVDVEGKKIDFNSFKNRLVVVNYWATWCPPCVAEMPSFQNLYDAYKDKVVFLFVANDEQRRVEKFIENKKYTIPVYYQVTQSPKEMQSNSLPTTFIINKNGEIVVNKTGAVNWNSNKVRNLLDNLSQ